jgi:PIN domain nuclease of toxin-antitoxin system
MPAVRALNQLWKATDRPDYDGPLLLDTHAWVWMLEGDASRMARAVLPMLERVAGNATLLVCDISYWEVAVKAAKGKLILSLDAHVWLRRAEQAPGVTPIAVERDILVSSTRLPGSMHGDPADRMLIAAAQLHGAPLLTIDAQIIDYAATQRGIPVCDARP